MDLIYREQAIKEIRREVSEQESNAIQGEDLDVGVIAGLKMAVRIIKEQPSAEKTGKWIKLDGCDTVQCSKCLGGFDYIDGLCYLIYGQELPNYCPNCGVKMEVVNDLSV